MRTGDDALIVGFIVTPGAPKGLIVRGIGPSLAVPEALANSTIEIFDDDGISLGSNDDWQTDSTAIVVPDLQLAPANSAESAMLRVLAPGAYTVILSGAGGGTGIGLLEAHDVGTDSTDGQ